MKIIQYLFITVTFSLSMLNNASQPHQNNGASAAAASTSSEKSRLLDAAFESGRNYNTNKLCKRRAIRKIIETAKLSQESIQSLDAPFFILMDEQYLQGKQQKMLSMLNFVTTDQFRAPIQLQLPNDTVINPNLIQLFIFANSATDTLLNSAHGNHPILLRNNNTNGSIEVFSLRDVNQP